MTKREMYLSELAKLREIFKDTEETKLKLIEGLIEDATFLKTENTLLKEYLAKTGMVKVHPQHPDIQKPIEKGKQYLKNVNSYAVIIKTMNSILSKNVIEDEDDLCEFE
jgi:hypothetical protein